MSNNLNNRFYNFNNLYFDAHNFIFNDNKNIRYNISVIYAL